MSNHQKGRDPHKRQPAPKPSRPEPKSPPSATRFSLVKLNQLNAFANAPEKADARLAHSFYIADRDWMTELRRAPEKRQRARLGTINEDLQFQNHYSLPALNTVDGLKYLLKSDLVIGYELELLTEDAWNYLMKFYDGLPIVGRFEVDEKGGRWSEVMRYLTFNLVVYDGASEPRSSVYQTSETRSVKEIISRVAHQIKVDPEDLDLAQLDTRLSLNDLTEALRQNRMVGRRLAADATFLFKYLQNFEAIAVYRREGVEVVEPMVGIEGLCAKCRKTGLLNYRCSCVINSYCSVDCKCDDYMNHRYMCKDLVEFREDVTRDVKTLDGLPERGIDVGLTNIGNSCYLNSLLQVLKTIPAVRQGLVATPVEEIGEAKFLLGFYHVMLKLLRTDRANVKPWPFKLALGLMANSFMNNAQHDSSEALDFMLNDLDASKVAPLKAVSDTFKGTTVNQFECKDCHKIQVRSVEDPFFLFQVPLILEAPSKEFLVTLIDEENTGLKGSRLMVGLKDKEFTIGLLARFAFDTDHPPKVLASVERKEETVALKDDADFRNFSFEKRVNPQLPLLITLQPVAEDSPHFLNVAVTQVVVIASMFKQYKRLCSNRFLQLPAGKVSEAGQVSGIDVHLRIFRAIRVHLFEQYPEFRRVFNEVMQKGYARGEEAFYQAAVLPKPGKGSTAQNPPAPSPKLSKEPSQQDTAMVVEPSPEDAEFFAKLVAEIQKEVQSLAELKGEQFYAVSLAHRGQVCKQCKRADNNACPVEFSRQALYSLGADAVASLRVNLEIHNQSKLIQHLQSFTEQELARQASKNPVDRQSYYLQTALDHVFAWEKIERKCEGCGSQNSAMQTSIKHHPEVLIMHLKRFKQDYDRFGNLRVVKKDDFMHYEFEMGIQGEKYELIGVVNHVGNLNDGHYTCAVRNWTTGDWWDCNDESVTRINDRESIRKKTNYILFFGRVAAPAEGEKKEAGIEIEVG